MKSIALMIIVLLIGLWAVGGQPQAAAEIECSECERQAQDFTLAYKAFLSDEGKGESEGPASKAMQDSKDILFKCLRYYGCSGMVADEVIKNLMQEAEKGLSRGQRP